MRVLTAAEWLSENSERQELALQNIPLAMELYAKYRETELSRPPKDVVEAIEKKYPISLVLCQNIYGSPAQRDANEELRTAALHGYSLASGDKWVSVSERLPEIGVEVLIWCEYGLSTPIIALRREKTWHISFETTEAGDSIDRNDGTMTGYTVTHWMELPSPPKQQQHG